MKSSFNKTCANKKEVLNNSKNSKNMKKIPLLGWFLFGIIIFGGLGYATTISDTGITDTPSVTAGNFLFGNSSGNFNYTVAERPLTSNTDSSKTVCSSGCDYTTIQEAINNVPLVLRHKYEINISAGTYNEDIYIPPIMNSRSSNSEGSVVPLSIRGVQGNQNAVLVKSIQVSGVVGTWGTEFSYLNVYGQEPTSDENVSIAIYGSNSVLFRNITINGTVSYGIMAYSSGVYIHSSTFTTNQKNAGLVKAGGFMKFGDDSGNSSNNGEVQDYIGTVSQGIFVINEDNQLNFGVGNDYFDCSTSGSQGGSSQGLAIVGGAIACPNTLSGTFSLGKNGYGDGILQIRANSSSNPVLSVKPFGCQGCGGSTFSRIDTSSSSNRTVVFDNSGAGNLNIRLNDGALIMVSPNGTQYECGVSNSGVFSCS